MRAFAFLATVALVSTLVPGLAPIPALADGPVWRHAMSLYGTPRYADGFSHFDYVNPAAPKGGELHFSSTTQSLGNDAFNSLNPFIDKGVTPTGLGFVFEPLMAGSLDEEDISAVYGDLAEAVQYPDDFAFAKFRLNPAAKWQDGAPVTPDDVVWSFDELRKVNISQARYYQHVVKAEVTGPHEVTFTFDEKGNHELPLIVSQMTVLPKHWWLANGADGKPRSIEETTLEPPPGSGPYRITAVEPGHRITYTRDPAYWGARLPISVGANNFATIVYDVYLDRSVEFEAFKAGRIDFWGENEARRWATGYDFAALKDGRVKREMRDRKAVSGEMVGFIPNLRRPQFKDERVREALNDVFDFEELNKTIFYGQYSRIDSYFFGTDLAASGLPTGIEKDILDGVKDKVPASVFSVPYTNPVGGDPARVRDNLRAAVKLFEAAGYQLKDGRMIGPDGKPFGFEILLDGPIIERVAVPYTQWLARIGVTATVRTVDASQFVARINSRDFDVIYSGWGESMSPGNEQADYWGSAAATRAASKNYAGIADAGVDALIDKVIFASDRTHQVAAVHALDRVLLAHHYVIPTYGFLKDRYAWWDGITHPDALPKFDVGFPAIWWAKP